MSNKVTNIYIDTTGFCDEALRRVFTALDTIVEHNGVENISPSAVKSSNGQNSVFFNCHGLWCYAGNQSPMLEGKRGVGLWGLESIALRCKQEKKEEPLPTRNIYIDARKLNPVERIKAFDVFLRITVGNGIDSAPGKMKASRYGNSAFILFDYYAITSDGTPLVVMEKSAYLYIDDKKEVSLDEFMGIVR